MVYCCFPCLCGFYFWSLLTSSFCRFQFCNHLAIEKRAGYFTVLLYCLLGVMLRRACAYPEGGGAGGPGTPPEKSQKIGFLSNTAPDPMKKFQSYQARIQFLAIIGTPAKRHFYGVSLMGQCWPAGSALPL